MLDRAGVRAVFFVCGWRLEAEEPLRSRARAILRNTLARGHVIGNHTVHHRVLPNLSTAQITYEIDHNADLIEEVIGQRPHLFRPPYGAYSEDVRRLVTARRYELWLWSLDSHDWQRVNDADGVAQAVITLIGNHAGGTVLLHDTHPWSVAAVPRILRWIEETNRERLHDRRPPYTIMDAPRYFAGARERLRTLPGAATARDGGLDDAPEPTTGAVGGGDPDAQGSDAPTVDAVADDHS
jgi:peptidoglycan/xylan/chitin deacetylase (PgdA/CDA1 family)